MLENLAPIFKRYHKYTELVDAGIPGILFGRPRKIFGCEACIFASGVHSCDKRIKDSMANYHPLSEMVEELNKNASSAK